MTEVVPHDLYVFEWLFSLYIHDRTRFWPWTTANKKIVDAIHLTEYIESFLIIYKLIHTNFIRNYVSNDNICQKHTFLWKSVSLVLQKHVFFSLDWTSWLEWKLFFLNNIKEQGNNIEDFLYISFGICSIKVKENGKHVWSTAN